MVDVWGLAVNWSLGSEKNIVLCIACSAYSIISHSIRISFVALLHCPYLNA